MVELKWMIKYKLSSYNHDRQRSSLRCWVLMEYFVGKGLIHKTLAENRLVSSLFLGRNPHVH